MCGIAKWRNTISGANTKIVNDDPQLAIASTTAGACEGCDGSATLSCGESGVGWFMEWFKAQ